MSKSLMPLTLARLVSLDPRALVAHVPHDPPEVPLDGVHISELPDPTPYLHGGELLLTTGLELPATTAGSRAYVARLLGARVAALALGLGPVHATVPTALSRACAQQGLPLLAVPAQVPFQAVTRAYWGAVGEEHEKPLHETIDHLRRLVAAAATDDPVPAILAVLAKAVEGWTTLTDAAGTPVVTWPPEHAAEAGALTADVLRLRPAGVRSSATFPVGDHVASLHPVVGDGETLGYLGTVSRTPISPHDRGLLLSTLALLGSDAAHRRRLRQSDRSLARAVALLIESGRVGAAEGLAHAVGLPPPPPRVRLVVARGASAAAAWASLAELLDDFGAPWWGSVRSGVARALVHPVGDLLDDQGRYAASAPDDADCVLGIGPVADLARVGPALAVLDGWVRTLPTGGVYLWRPGVVPFASDAWAQEVLRPLRKEDPEVQSVLTAFLAHRGRWEAVATQTGLHRNSVRARITRAEQALGADLTDPDVSARLWLALRATGADSIAAGRARR